MKRLILSSVLALTMAVSLGASTAASQNNSRQAGLVNVSAGNVELLNGVNIGVAANVLATVCGFEIPIALLAVQNVGPGGTTFCTANTRPIIVEQSQPGDGGGTPTLGGNNSRQAGLINVSLGDVRILNDVNLGVAANILITACGFRVPVAILSAQTVAGGGTTVCDSDAGPIRLTQS